MMTRKTQYLWMTVGALLCLMAIGVALKVYDNNKVVAETGQQVAQNTHETPQPEAPPTLPEVIPVSPKTDEPPVGPTSATPKAYHPHVAAPFAVPEPVMAPDEAKVSGNATPLPAPPSPIAEGPSAPPQPPLAPTISPAVPTPGPAPLPPPVPMLQPTPSFTPPPSPGPVVPTMPTPPPPCPDPMGIVPLPPMTPPAPEPPPPPPLPVKPEPPKETRFEPRRLEPVAPPSPIKPVVGTVTSTEEIDAIKPLPGMRPKSAIAAAKKPLPLTGTYPCTIDEKHVLTLPKALRDQLGNPDTILVSPGPDQCLWITNQAHLERLADRLEQSPAKEADVRVFKRLYFAQIEKTPLSDEGKVGISERLVQFAGLRQDVVLIGIDEHFELWDAASWRTYTQKKSAEARSAMAEHE